MASTPYCALWSWIKSIIICVDSLIPPERKKQQPYEVFHLMYAEKNGGKYLVN